MPEWGAMYYDSKIDTWNDFGPSNGAWRFPGRPRSSIELIYILIINRKIVERNSCAKWIFKIFYIYRNHFACGIYRNNLVFSGGLYQITDHTTGRNSSHHSIADDINMFNIRYSL